MAENNEKNLISASRARNFVSAWMRRHGLDNAAAAIRLGQSYSTLTNFLNGSKSVSLAKMEEIAKAIGVDLADMLAKDQDDQTGNEPLKILTPHVDLAPADLESYEFLKIPFSDHMRLAAGGGGAVPYTYEAEDSPVVVHHSLLDMRSPNAKHLQAFRVGGDSMDPIITKGAIVVADLARNSTKRLDDGAIYVICWDFDTEECAVKRLRWADKGKLLAIESADPLVNPTIYRRPEDVTLVGRVVWSWRTH